MTTKPLTEEERARLAASAADFLASKIDATDRPATKAERAQLAELREKWARAGAAPLSNAGAPPPRPPPVPIHGQRRQLIARARDVGMTGNDTRRPMQELAQMIERREQAIQIYHLERVNARRAAKLITDHRFTRAELEDAWAAFQWAHLTPEEKERAQRARRKTRRPIKVLVGNRRTRGERGIKLYREHRSRLFKQKLAEAGNDQIELADLTDEEIATAARTQSSEHQARKALATLPPWLAFRIVDRVCEGNLRLETNLIIVAIAKFLWNRSIPAKRNGMEAIALGFSVGMLCTLVHFTQGQQRRTSRNGTHPGKHWMMTNVIRPLEQAGILHVEQPPADVCPPALVGKHQRRPRGSDEPEWREDALNHYWFINPDELEKHLDADDLAQLDLLLGGWEPLPLAAGAETPAPARAPPDG